MALLSRLHRVLQPDSCGIATSDVQVANAEAHMNVATRDELASIGVCLFIAPVVCGAQGDKKQTQQESFVGLKGLKRRSLRHGAPRERTSAISCYVTGRTIVPAQFRT